MLVKLNREKGKTINAKKLKYEQLTIKDLQLSSYISKQLVDIAAEAVALSEESYHWL